MSVFLLCAPRASVVEEKVLPSSCLGGSFENVCRGLSVSSLLFSNVAQKGTDGRGLYEGRCPFAKNAGRSLGDRPAVLRLAVVWFLPQFRAR